MRTLIICLASVVFGQQVPAAPETWKAEPTLREAAGHKLLIGAAINSFSLRRPELAARSVRSSPA